MVFLAKGVSDLGDSGNDGVNKSPEDTRPLSLGNTDAKMIAMLADDALSSCARRTVALEQTGFVRGRSMSDNIMPIESQAIAWANTALATSATVLFDFSAAFPSLAHAWIWFILSCMGVPQYFITLLQGLYHECFATISLRGGRFYIISILSGIRQGWPASGSIFALSLDPCVRKIIFTLPLASARLGAYADDMAVVLKNLLADFAKLLK